MNIRYTHTNIIAADWKRLAEFYQNVFECVPVPPERDYSGEWIGDAIGEASDFKIRGMHLRLPGFGEHGPTLEIFQYDKEESGNAPAANRPGFGHIAFHVDDVAAMRDRVLSAGGADLGKLISMDVPNAGHIDFIYMTDPEGNIVELQTWR